MSREAFLARLNIQAANRYGLPEVTDDVLGDWLEAKIVPSPRQKGRLRIWTRAQYRHALEILRLKSHGVESLGEVRWHLWIIGFEIPLFNSHLSSRKTLIKIFRRDLKELMRPISSKYQPAKNESKKDKWRADTLIQRMGDLDPELQRTVIYERSELLSLYGIAKFGGAIDNAAGAMGRMIFAMTKPFVKTVTVEAAQQESILKLISRFAGNPHEEGNRAERSILEAAEADFRLARRAFQVISASPWPFGPKVRRSLTTPRWRVGLFVWLLHATARGGGKLASLSASEIDKIPELLPILMKKNR